jgi:hypothetical protein
MDLDRDGPELPAPEAAYGLRLALALLEGRRIPARNLACGILAAEPGHPLAGLLYRSLCADCFGRGCRGAPPPKDSGRKEPDLVPCHTCRGRGGDGPLFEESFPVGAPSPGAPPDEEPVPGTWKRDGFPDDATFLDSVLAAWDPRGARLLREGALDEAAHRASLERVEAAAAMDDAPGRPDPTIRRPGDGPARMRVRRTGPTGQAGWEVKIETGGGS